MPRVLRWAVVGLGILASGLASAQESDGGEPIDAGAPVPAPVVDAGQAPASPPAPPDAGALSDAELDKEFQVLNQLWNEDVVAASLYVQSVRQIAAPTVVITQEQIRARGYRDLKDIFRDLPGFDVSENVQGEVRTMVIPRGMTGDNKLLILMDGQRLNAITGERFVFGNNVPLAAAKRVEIVYGPAAAVYGPDAYAGVINIVTIDGRDLRGAELTASVGLLHPTLGSWATDDSAVVGTSLGENSDVMLSARLYHSPRGVVDFYKDYPELAPLNYYNRGGFTPALPVNDYDVYGKLRLGSFTLGARFSDAAEPNAPSTIPDNYLYTDKMVWRQKMAHVFVTQTQKTDKLEATTALRYQQYEVDPDTNFYIPQTVATEPGATNWDGSPINIPLQALPEYKYARTDSIRLEEQLTFFASKTLTLSGGGLVERVFSFPKTRNLNEGPFDPDHLVVDMGEFVDPKTGKVLGVTSDRYWGVRPYTNLGVYAQGEYLPTEALRLTLGGRFDYNTNYGQTVNPRLGAVYRVTPEALVRLSAGTAYIQPSNYYVWENWANPFAMHIPNLDLRPERVYTADLGGSYQVLRNLDLELDVYYNQLVDIIRPVPYTGGEVYNPYLLPGLTGYVEINANRGEQRTYGGELKANWVPRPNLHAYGSYAYLDGRDLDSDFPINKISHHKLLAGCDWKALEWLSVSPRLRWFSPITMANTNSLYQLRLTQAGGDASKVDSTFGDPWGTFLLDANIRAELGHGFSVFLDGHNLLNRRYYTAAPYAESIWILPRAPQPGINFMTGVTWAI